MKWIKTAIGALIAISIIPLVVLSAINIKKSLETEKKITITFEMDYSHLSFDVYFFSNTLSNEELIDYVEKGYTISNLYDYTNDITITITIINWNFEDLVLEMFDNNSVEYKFFFSSGYIFINNSYDSIYNANAKDIVLMDIILTKNPIKNHKLIATLISFVPIIFVGGVVLFFYKPFKKD